MLSATSDPARRVAMVNEVLAVLQAHDAEVAEPARQLRRMNRPGPLGAPGLPDTRPSTPLTEPALLTNTRGEPNLGAELRAEIDTSDEVDLLCAFVKWHGLRLLESELSRLRSAAPRCVSYDDVHGRDERRALDRLVHDFGAEVRIQYDDARTRLHAKAWMFRRDTRFDTAYVGSSNLSRAALLDGVEWNVRLSTTGTGALLDKFQPPSTPTGTTPASRSMTPCATQTDSMMPSMRRLAAQSTAG